MTLPRGFVKRDVKIVNDRKKLIEKINSVLIPSGFREGYPAVAYDAKSSFPRDGFDDRIKFIDSDGSVLCLAEDAVTALLQSAESEYGRVYGCCESYKFFGENRNELTFAALLAGVGGVEAEAELITVGVKIMEKLGIPVGEIRLGNTKVLHGVAESCLKRTVTKSDIKRNLSGNIYSEEDYSAIKLLQEIAAVKGGVSVIGTAAEKITNKQSVDGLISLFELSKILGEYGYTDNVTFDLGYAGSFYDNGVTFLLCDAAGNKIIDGGRHDYFSDGSIKRVVSLRLYPDYILSIKPELREKETDFDVAIGVADGINALRAAYRLKNGLIDEGLKVTVVYKAEKESFTKFAVAMKIENVIFIDADGNIMYE